MKLTFEQMIKKKETREYPEEKWVPPPSYRGAPVYWCLRRTASSAVWPAAFARASVPPSPSKCRPPRRDEKERYPELFEINMLRCIFCGFCEEVCPEEAIVMSQTYELAFRNYSDAIFGKDKLLTPVEELRPRLEYLRAHR
jgi:NADH-quinone oxidoreductase subunit I